MSAVRKNIVCRKAAKPGGERAEEERRGAGAVQKAPICVKRGGFRRTPEYRKFYRKYLRFQARIHFRNAYNAGFLG
ncbi:hypothetical protein [Paraburkholderia sp. J41]|uniref:hypothetical protein n=1 Tax=Paraburkholderia sp. J41 TaxID=2805433 RepID=UPI002AC35A64|nr:hypothetical protein [Paraburkholderia sp. J41]